VRGNYIGTNAGGNSAFGNARAGVECAVGSLSLGSTAPQDRNLISNNGIGVWIAASGTAGVVNNQIGGRRNGSAGNGNLGRGIYFNGVAYSSSSASINYVRYNGAAGIVIDAATFGAVTLVGNASYGNGGIGIDLHDDGPTANDEAASPYDTDGVQNYPVVTSVTQAGGNTVVSGYLKSVASCCTYPFSAVIELYHNNSPTTKTEGQQLIDSFASGLDATGVINFTRTIAGTWNNISATATADSCGDGCYRSSEYSPSTAVASAGPPSLTLIPASLTFATRTVSTTSAPQTVTLTNNGPGALAISSITVGGDYAFTSACPGSLAVGATCTLDVTFTPVTLGARSGVVTIFSNASGSPHAIPLSGTGQTSGAPVIQVTPTIGEFAPQDVGSESAPRLFVIVNAGVSELFFSGFSVSGPGFTLQPTVTNSNYQFCGAALFPGAVCAVQVTFAATAPGPASGVLRIKGNAANSPLEVSLVATGVVGPPPRALSMASSLAFPDQGVGTQSVGQALGIANNSSSVASVTGLTASGDFSVSDTCGTIPAHGTCAPLVFFQPSVTGARAGTLTVQTLSEANPYVVSLSGNGVFNPVPQAELSLTRLGFGNTLLGVPAGAQIVLRNVGQLPVVIESIVASGDYFVSHTCGISVAIAASCTIHVSFYPRMTGARPGDILIRTNAAGSPHAVQLSGVGCGLPTLARARSGSLVCGP
jgi:hypothetical protein